MQSEVWNEVMEAYASIFKPWPLNQSHLDLIPEYRRAAKMVGYKEQGDWATWYAGREPHLEAALGGICWDYDHRPVVAAIVAFLYSLASGRLGPSNKVHAQKLRKIADMIENGDE